MTLRLPTLLALLCLLPALEAADPTAPRQLTVYAGEMERRDSIVQAETPGLLPGSYELQSGDVKTVLQVGADGWGAFVEPGLARGATRTYEIAPASLEATGNQVEVHGNESILSFSSGKQNQPMLSYQMKPGTVPEGIPPIFAHGAHLHPVYSPGGHLVTGNHPPDHPHHRGIWMSWTKTSFEGRSPDFWNMGKDKSGKLTGEVRFESLSNQWSGPVHGGFVSSHRHFDHTSGVEKPVLAETWTLKIYRDLVTPQPLRVFDLSSAQSTAGAEPLKLPKYHYGGLGVRGNRLWDAEDDVTMLTSNGDGRKAGDSTTAKWVYIGGDVEGENTGMVVLIHPENFRFPQPLRLNPKNPQLSVAPSQQGDWAIEPGQTYVSKYRFVVLDGKPDSDLMDRLWQDYAHPAEVKMLK